MKYAIQYFGILFLMAILIAGCGPSEEEQRQREQARQDSLEQARQDSLQQVRQQRQDSLAQARADSTQQAQENESIIMFTENGRFTVQVASWRSQVKAQQEASSWQERGYENAYIVQHGNEATGDVWFRVRIGRVDSREMAQKLQQELREEHQTDSWITTAN